MNNFLNKEGLVHRHRISNVYLCQSLYCYEMASYFNQKLFSFKTSILYFCHMSWTQPRYKYFHITLLLCFAITLALTKQLSIRPESNIVPFRVYKVTLFNTMVIVWIGKTLSNALLDVQLSTLQSSLMHLYHRWARGGGAQWSETHIDPPKNPKNCVTVLYCTSKERLFCPKVDFNHFKHFLALKNE